MGPVTEPRSALPISVEEPGPGDVKWLPVHVENRTGEAARVVIPAAADAMVFTGTETHEGDAAGTIVEIGECTFPFWSTGKTVQELRHDTRDVLSHGLVHAIALSESRKAVIRPCHSRTTVFSGYYNTELREKTLNPLGHAVHGRESEPTAENRFNLLKYRDGCCYVLFHPLSWPPRQFNWNS